jgi:16S rRNA (adenine1518-N6/adenine1519-N6)-dimethyltransferase
MNLASKKIIKEILKKHSISPSKRLGQNFLIDESVIRKIISAAELKKTDTVLEIGPGIGTLTQELAKKVKLVISVEKDSKMCEILKQSLKDFKNIKVIEDDILKFNFLSYKFPRSTPPFPQKGRGLRGRQVTDYKIIANLPFYLTAAVIRKFLEANATVGERPKEMVLIVQKEVGQRICPRPPKLKERRRGKTSQMNLLAVSIQFYAKPKIISYVSKKSFWPQPKVDSAIIKISKIKNQKSKINKFLFFRIVRAGFSHPRKQILNNLSEGLKLKSKEVCREWLLKNKIQPEQRAESLSIQDWIDLTKTFMLK